MTTQEREVVDRLTGTLRALLALGPGPAQEAPLRHAARAAVEDGIKLLGLKLKES